jgi:hypothetical protein
VARQNLARVAAMLAIAAAFTFAYLMPSPLLETVPQGAVVYRIDCGPEVITLAGEPGAPGQDGADGVCGEVGECGPQGEPGPQGETGAIGPQGEQGPQGEPGPQGDQGDTGATGAQGRPGATGQTGATGAPGATGECGPIGPQGLPGPAGPAGPQGLPGLTTFGDFGSFYHNPIISPLAANTTTVMPLTSTVVAKGISADETGQITVSKAGVYNIQFSAQIYKGDSEKTDIIDIWLRRNGENVPSTNGRITMPKTDFFRIAAWNFMATAEAEDYFELVFSTNDTSLVIKGLAPQANPDRPAVPSLILTVQQVG